MITSILYAYVHWRRFSYVMTDDQLIIESGILSRNRRTIPMDRIQDISLEQSLLARLFGVSIVRIETGSSGKDEGELNCVSREEAGRLRDKVRRFRAGTEASERIETPATEQQAAPTLYSMGMDRLMLAGFFNFSLVFLAMIVGAWQYFGSFIPVEVFDSDKFLEEQRQSLLEWASLMSALALVSGFLIIGIVTGLVRTIARAFGFRLTRSETGLRRQRGLFTRTDVVIPLRRVQAAIISTGLIRRRFGWHSLALQSLGNDGGSGSNHVAAPFAQRHELEPILDELEMPSPVPEAVNRKVSLAYVSRSWIVEALRLAIVYGIAAQFWDLAGLILLAAPVLFVAPVLQYRGHRYAIDGDDLFVRHGFFRPRLTIISMDRIQTITLRQSLFQQALGIATLVCGTAGASASRPLKIIDLPEDTARHLMNQELHWLAANPAV
jgi:putative membrane protein